MEPVIDITATTNAPDISSKRFTVSLNGAVIAPSASWQELPNIIEDIYLRETEDWKILARYLCSVVDCKLAAIRLHMQAIEQAADALAQICHDIKIDAAEDSK